MLKTEYVVRLDITYTATAVVIASDEDDALDQAKEMAKRDQLDKDYCHATHSSIQIESD